MKALKTMLLAVVALAVLAGIGVYSGLFNFAADEPHWAVTTRLIDIARERSIERQADAVKAPGNLLDAKLIAGGAGEYAEMCAGCHLAPGTKDTEIRTGLYPKPPDLTANAARRSAEQQFWIIKHGLKMTGMPAWGLTHDDERIWSMVAFLRELPELTPAAYQELIGAGEGGHHHDDMEHADSDSDASAGEKGHEHAEGKEHADSLPQQKAAAPPHDHGAHSHAEGNAVVQLPPAALNAAETVDSFQKRLAQGDTSGAAQLLDPAVLIYEGGGAEKSRAEYASHHLKSDAKFLKDAEIRQLSRTGNGIGDLAWVATESEIKAPGAKPVDLIATETMILQRGPEGWRIKHIHWSSHAK